MVSGLLSMMAVLVHIHTLVAGKGSFHYSLTNNCDLSLCSNHSDRERGSLAITKHLVIRFAQFLDGGYLEPCVRLPFCQLSQALEEYQSQGTLLPTFTSIFFNTKEEAIIQNGVQLT